MTGFEPQTSGTGDNRSANSATATAPFAFVFVLTSWEWAPCNRSLEIGSRKSKNGDIKENKKNDVS